MTTKTKTASRSLDDRINDYLSQLGCDGVSWRCYLCEDLIAERERLIDAIRELPMHFMPLPREKATALPIEAYYVFIKGKVEEILNPQHKEPDK